MNRAYVPALVVFVIGLFWLVAGGGPSILLPIVVILIGVGMGVATKKKLARSGTS